MTPEAEWLEPLRAEQARRRGKTVSMVWHVLPVRKDGLLRWSLTDMQGRKYAYIVRRTDPTYTDPTYYAIYIMDVTLHGMLRARRPTHHKLPSREVACEIIETFFMEHSTEIFGADKANFYVWEEEDV